MANCKAPSQRETETALGRRILTDEIRDGDTVQVTLDHSSLAFHAPPHEGAKPEKEATGKKG